MNTIRVVGIDIAKSVFQVCIWMIDGSVAWNRKRDAMTKIISARRLEPHIQASPLNSLKTRTSLSTVSTLRGQDQDHYATTLPPMDPGGMGELGLVESSEVDGEITIFLYRRKYMLGSGGEIFKTKGELIDVPAQSWIDVRLDMPDDSIWKRKYVGESISTSEQRICWYINFSKVGKALIIRLMKYYGYTTAQS